MSDRDVSQGLYRQLRKMHGITCRICGEEGVDYHHIIPLSHGGTNEINNFIPLCHKHHMMVHGCREQAGLRARGNCRGGRPRKIPANYKDILCRYVHGEIGRAECQLMLDMGKHSKLQDTVWYKEYLNEMGINTAHNTVDVLSKNGTLAVGRFCGFIEYKDGTIENLYWGEDDC